LLDGSVMQYCMDYAASFLGVQSKIFNMYEWVNFILCRLQRGLKFQRLEKYH